MKYAALVPVLVLIGCGQRPPQVDQAMAAKRAVVYTTADSTTLRLSPTDTLVFKPTDPTSEGKVYVFVDPRKAFQTMLGIGGALTDAAAETNTCGMRG